jgi:hypothetical protein
MWKRLALVVFALLALTRSAAATPVSYSFLARVGTTDIPGLFSYDGDTGAASLSFSTCYQCLNPSLEIGGTGLGAVSANNGLEFLTFTPTQTASLWPDNKDTFPIYYYTGPLVQLTGADILDGNQLRHGLTDADFNLSGFPTSGTLIDVYWVGVTLPGPDPHDYGCAAGTPIVDCPRSSFPYVDTYDVYYALHDFHEVPEPAVAALALVSLGAALLRRHN